MKKQIAIFFTLTAVLLAYLFILPVYAKESDKTSVSLQIDAEKSYADVAIGYTCTLPDVTVKATDASGNAIDLSGKVNFTVYHGDDTQWNPLTGLTNVRNTPSARKIKIDKHGYYKIVYSVQNGTKTAEAVFRLNVQDTVTGIETEKITEPIPVHPGETIDLSGILVYGNFSYTGQRSLKQNEYSVSPEKAPEKIGDFSVSLTLIGTYDNATIKKTVTVPFRTVSADTEIDRTKLELTPEATTVNISYRLPYTIPDVTATATLGDGTKQDLHDSVTWSVYHHSGTEWVAVSNQQNLPLVKKDGTGRDFIPTEHGYYQIIYKISLNGKTKTETVNLNIMDTLTGITVDTTNVKTVCAVGENLDLSGLIVHKILSYTGQSNVMPGEYKIDRGGFDKTKVGDYTVTISYTAEFGGKKTASFTVSVIDPVVSAKMTALPEKLTYTLGTPMDMTGAAAVAVLQNAGETTIPGSELEIVGYDSLITGEQQVSFFYRGISAGTATVVVEDRLYAVDIDATAVKKTYTNKEKADLTGLQVTAVFASGARRTLDTGEYAVTPADFSGAEPGTYTLRVSCKDKLTGEERFASFRVEVTDAGETGSLLPLLIGGGTATVICIAVVLFLLIKKKKSAA